MTFASYQIRYVTLGKIRDSQRNATMAFLKIDKRLGTPLPLSTPPTQCYVSLYGH